MGLPAPNQQVRLNYTLSVQNHCPQAIKDVTYQIQATGDCISTTLQFFRADPSLVAPGDSAGVKAGQDPSMTASCNKNGWGMNPSSSPPSSLSVDIYASGTDPTTNSRVHSQEKIFTVLGSSDSGWAPRCHQKCPPATDTPSVVFVHGLNGRSDKGSGKGHDCSAEWGKAMDFLRKRGLTDLRTIKHYNHDGNCDADLHDPSYTKHCTDYHADAGPDGTNDESLYHLSCLLS